jgi:hypothetical protein
MKATMFVNRLPITGRAFAVAICLCLFLQAAEARPVKAAHFVLGPSSPDAVAVRFEDAMRILVLADELGFNTIVLQIANGVNLDSAPRLARPGAWAREQLKDFADQARSRGLDVVPEFKFLTHQEKFLQTAYPELLYNAVTYDPRKEAVYEIVFAMLDEVIDLIKPKAVSIGHDEVVGWNPHHARRHLGPDEAMLPADLFLYDVKVLHEFLAERNVETWMWGDMLLSPEQFAGYASTYFHGNRNGYGKALRREIPREIVICDWQYTNNQAEFPSMKVFQDDGFRVIGSVWEDAKTAMNFGQYAADSSAMGMMATTWFYVPQRRWDRVEKILESSAEAFRALDQHDE